MEANSDPKFQRTPINKEKCETPKNVQNRPNMQVATCQFSTLPNRPIIVVSAPLSLSGVTNLKLMVLYKLNYYS